MTVPYDPYIVVAVAITAVMALILIGILIEFSLRKRRPQPPAEVEAHRAHEAHAHEPVAEAAAPTIAPAETPAALPPREPKAEAAPEPPKPEIKRPPVEPKPAAPSQAAVSPAPVSAAPPAPAVSPPPTVPAAPVRLSLGLRRTRENFLGRLRAAISGKAKVDEIYEGLEEALIAADVGVEASMKLVDAVRTRLKNNANADTVRDVLQSEITAMLAQAQRPPADSGQAPLVVMMVGVNGAGKTTTVAKLASRMKAERGSVLVGAADTFRAAAIEQLQVWCDRVGVDLIKQKQGSDPAAVAFDTVKAALARKASTVLIDTAGRLQTKVNLMEELKKVARVIGREIPGAPHETWLVLDATTGQNALSQAKLFADAVPLTGVVLAKLDSTAKGGVVVAVAERLKLPVRFVGVGEGLQDLRPFDAREFADALFSEEQGDQASGSYAA
ncbi:MAG: signal recognition particle-docking protein FtsY [Candidatus Binataceae bacterium]